MNYQKTGWRKAGFYGSAFCGFIVPLGLIIAMVVTSNAASDNGDEKVAKLRTLGPFAKCVDTYA